jgi:hypothetical protein
VSVSGKTLGETRAFSEKVVRALERLPDLRDVHIPIALD